MSKIFKTKTLITFLTLMLLIFVGGNKILALSVNDRDTSSLRYFDFKDDEFVKPSPTGFNNWINREIVTKHHPHHNGYDEIYTKNQPQVIEGDFLYGDVRVKLANEWVSIYEYSLDSSSPSWNKIGRAVTDTKGHIKYNIPDNMKLGCGMHLIKLYVEGDGTSANMYIQVLDNTKKYVVFDMDGTLTTTDFEDVKQYAGEFFNSNYVAKMYPDADNVVKYYASKGYGILYLTARPYWLSEESQTWLWKNGFPMGLLHTYTGGDLLLGEEAESFKAGYLNQLKSQGIEFDYGFGNEKTDVEAYSNIGIAKSNIFTIGKNRGIDGSVSIVSYTDYLKQLSGN
ncbi:lipin LNS2 [Clostridium acetobutylicum]|nr:lipin LNS2 [Clostridium acetobutylicum]